MGATGLRPDGGIGVRFSVASRTRGAEFGVAPRGLSGGTPPHRLRRQFGDATSEIGKADLIREGGGQRDPDAGDHFGDPPGDFDQAEADRVELGLAPERGPRRQPAQGQHQPVGGGVQHQADLIGQGGAATGAVGSELALVQLDQVLGLAARAIQRVIQPFGVPERKLVTT